MTVRITLPLARNLADGIGYIESLPGFATVPAHVKAGAWVPAQYFIDGRKAYAVWASGAVTAVVEN